MPASKEKACKILHDGTVHGQELTPPQRRYFGLLCSGGTPRKAAGGTLVTFDHDYNVAFALAEVLGEDPSFDWESL